MPRRLIITLLFLMSMTAACTLLEGPPQPVLPTPMPTAVPFDAGSVNLGELVFDPVSNVVPKVDPAITGLLNEVSQQQLMGYVQTLESFGTRNSFSVTDQQNSGIGAARLWIYNEFIRVGNGRLQVQQQTFPLNYNGLAAEQQNIVATLPGTSGSTGVVVVMAHYDTRPAEVTDGVSRAPGANDNGSGVALLLETARVLSSRGWNHTVIFAALAAEEQGTYGARHLLQDLYLRDVPILAAINYDTVGGRSGIPQSIRLFAPDMLMSPSGELGRYYNFISGLYVPTFPINIINSLDREGRWGDQREFVNANVRAVRLTESEEDYTLLNSVKDSWGVIDYTYLQQVTQINVATVANTIGAPAMPSPPNMAPMDDPGSFILNWAPDPMAAGYVISFRPIDSPDFVPFRFVGAHEAGNVALTGFDPGMSYAVSLAALDENGRISLFSPEVIITP
ncbi:MAG: M20/M25/M40 family metallo-hydrolase [Ardenticatenaceae bacterium]|nr:M20/M25/M40 family metallo-hydrolase [Ardenticatenaceae bacterium]MCB9442814.1 M20/M25/M40 family metallo-hydrolase [Ardenticatenaceae bacterium]